jgi:hypothetical protein
MEKTVRHKSGYLVRTDVFFYEEINKYSPGFLVINPGGGATNRISPSQDLFDSEAEAADFSLKCGRRLLSEYLSGSDVLSFS